MNLPPVRGRRAYTQLAPMKFAQSSGEITPVSA